MKKLQLKIFIAAFIILLANGSYAFSWIYLQESVAIGGIKQWISIKGADKKNPVLLFLHGGPGNSAMGYDEKFTKILQKHFIVIQWDQRDVERTLNLNSSDKQLSVQLIEADAVELINYLRKRFSQNKIYLVGQSWGGFLGLKIANDHPELLEAYFAVSPMIWQDESERLSLEWAKSRAKQKDNKTEMEELAKVHVPFKNTDDVFYHRKWIVTEMGSKPASREFVDRWSGKWLPLTLEASNVNFFEIAPEIKCPIYFMIGDRDYQTYFKLAEDYFKMLKAEKKELFWFANTGHNIPTARAAKFQQIIIANRNIRN
ncbi:alpha/beta hydrolase [soil metagenome]